MTSWAFGIALQMIFMEEENQVLIISATRSNPELNSQILNQQKKE